MTDPYDVVIFDLDGVVYLGTEPVPGASAAIKSLVDSGAGVVYVTNNASRRSDEVAELLRTLDVPAQAGDVLTSAAAAAELLADDLPAGSAVLVVGAPALAEEVRAVGLNPVTRAEDRPVAVVQGFGPSVGWPELAEAAVAIRAGARWVATNTDATMPSPRGALPGNGSLVAALATALDRAPDTVVGKPEPALFTLAARHRAARRALAVGDRLDTDIRGAARAELDSLLVLTGVSTPLDLLRSEDRPTYVGADCAALSTLDGARIPPSARTVQVNGWTAARADDRLRLTGSGDDLDALRALAAAAWSDPEWTTVEGDPGVLDRLRLGTATAHRD